MPRAYPVKEGERNFLLTKNRFAGPSYIHFFKIASVSDGEWVLFRDGVPMYDGMRLTNPEEFVTLIKKIWEGEKEDGSIVTLIEQTATHSRMVESTTEGPPAPPPAASVESTVPPVVPKKELMCFQEEPPMGDKKFWEKKGASCNQ